jgi:hypothetical protein
MSALKKLAHDERVSASVMAHRMVEQVLVSDTLAAPFLEYVHDYWWGHKATAARSVGPSHPTSNNQYPAPILRSIGYMVKSKEI